MATEIIKRETKLDIETIQGLKLKNFCLVNLFSEHDFPGSREENKSIIVLENLTAFPLNFCFPLFQTYDNHNSQV